jgi:GAF domain-containing protein
MNNYGKMCNFARMMNDKQQTYAELLPQIAALVEGEKEEMSVLANVAAALHTAPLGFWWTGFYLVRQGELRLGPFQGPVACMHIGRGRGVCGTCWQREQTVIVPDVEQFPGHIACSAASRSEIVVPVKNRNGAVVGVLDIDSKELSAFDKTDQYYLEQVVALVGKAVFDAD